MSQDFGKGKIYKITNDYNDEVYIGSTCDLLTKRFSYHKCDHIKERCKNIPIYKLMNEIGFERFRIELIEDYQCQDKYQLRQREGHFIRELATLNKRIEGRTKQEYKEYYQEYFKKYQETNKDKIQEHKKEIYEANKDKILENQKQYRENNKDNNKDKRKEKITCECGSIICKSDIIKHKKTIKHQELMKTIQTLI